MILFYQLTHTFPSNLTRKDKHYLTIPIQKHSFFLNISQ